MGRSSRLANLLPQELAGFVELMAGKTNQLDLVEVLTAGDVSYQQMLLLTESVGVNGQTKMCSLRLARVLDEYQP